MIITAEELKTAIYDDKMAFIVEGDESIVVQAIVAAEEEVMAYLANRYDTEAILSAEGNDRNALIVETVKTVAVWQVIKLSNSEIDYEMWKERYDRSIKFLTAVSNGKITPRLPLLSKDGQVATTSRCGSNAKFDHHL